MANILIVDDDLKMTELLKTLLQLEGYMPTAVNDSTKAIQVAGSVEPDLITLDLMMPGLDGFGLCELLQQDPRLTNVPILIISARDDLESKQRALKAGAKAYVTKPFQIDELLQKIRDLISA